MNKIYPALFILIAASLACSLPGVASQPVPSQPPPTQQLPALPSETIPPPPTETPLPSPTLTASLTPTPTWTATITLTPTPSETPEPSVTPTLAAPQVTVSMQAHCRYGPHKAYLHAADLYAGDVGTVIGRISPYLSRWLYIKFDKLNYQCWVAPSVVTLVGDVETVKIMEFTDRFLPGPSVLYNHPHNVVATRSGKNVTISWDMVAMTKDDDRGYFLEMYVCQGGGYIWYPVSLENRDMTSYTIKDESGCPLPSSGKLYAVEKHGYTSPIDINWPQP